MKLQDTQGIFGTATLERKAYRSPTLTEHGDVRDLTLGCSGCICDWRGGNFDWDWDPNAPSGQQK
jgi:hypothetical protein